MPIKGIIAQPDASTNRILRKYVSTIQRLTGPTALRISSGPSQF